MIKETTIDHLFGTTSTYFIATFWSKIEVCIDASSYQEALALFVSIIPYGSALGPSIKKLERKINEDK